MTAAHGDPGGLPGELHVPAACAAAPAAVTACTAGAADSPSAQAVVVATGKPVATTTAMAKIGINFRSIFPPLS
ncbi:hypothetical protein ACFQX6_59455 [Streptosporangium lutulentum]